MEAIKTQRKVVRTTFTRLFTNLSKELQAEVINPRSLNVTLTVLKEKTAELQELNNSYFAAMQAAQASEADMVKEIEGCDEYTTKYHQAEYDVGEALQPTGAQGRPVNDNAVQFMNQTLGNLTARENKQYNLPKVELPKFSGDIKEWLQFWSLFKTIHEDDMPAERKFQYLVQSMIKGSRASEVVNSFPPTAENYEKAVTALKNRFGKDELIIEVYVRELLRLVLNNVMKPNEKIQLTCIYDKLETQLRALDSLGVTSAMYAAMLYPLVESSLPEELLRAWQRHLSTLSLNNTKERLDKLMAFLQGEVESEERIAMAVNGFGLASQSEKITKDTETKKRIKTEPSNVATATGFLAVKEPQGQECIFCKEAHENASCAKAREMSLKERQTIARNTNACFNCLIPGHSFRACNYKGKCAWCNKRHVLLMCRQMSTSPATTPKTDDTNSSRIEEHNLANIVTNPEIFLQTLQVKLLSQGKERIVRALIDSGSQHSYVSGSLAADLDFEVVGTQTMVHLLFGGQQSEPQQHKRYRLHVRSLDDAYACTFVAYHQDVICKGIVKMNNGSWIRELEEKSISLTDIDTKNQPISLLIGADIAGKLLTGKVSNLSSGLTAIETHLGWTVMGKSEIQKSEHKDSALVVMSMFVQDATLSDLWSLDVLGIEDPVQRKTKSMCQQEVLEKFRETMTMDDSGRYQVTLPWKENHPPIPSNRDLAEYRLENTLKKLETSKLTKEYEKVFDEWLAEGIIEKVPEEELSKPAHYLPHRPVVKENSTTRIRPVFDASAKKKDHPSLNQCLETGPNLIEQIPSLLLRFRVGELGIISDIRKAFLQISLAGSDRDYLRFLWKRTSNPTATEVYRHRRVVFGVSSSPFLLGATIDLHLEKTIERTDDQSQTSLIKKLKRSFYVDNCVTSVQDETEMNEFRETATVTMMSGGFELRGWEFTGQKGVDSTTPLLGLTWNKREDTLMLAETTLFQSPPSPVTKRSILSAAQKVFDPVGMICPVILCPKILLQKLWSQEVGWDTPLEGDIKDTFLQWQRDLRCLKTVKIPRWVFGRPESSISLHLFVDASKEAYAAVVFSRVESENGIDVNLVEAKSRVAPEDNITIPRLELLAATVGARLMNSIIESLDPELRERLQQYFWTDSSTVLSWIQRQTQWATFVWNRVQEIRKLTNVNQWRHVPGELNPADLPSRGCSAKYLIESQWWMGPSWLREPVNDWPKSNPQVSEEEIVSELKKTALNTRHSKETAEIVSETDHVMSNVTVAENRILSLSSRISKYPMILRAMAYVQRFIFNCRNYRGSKRDDDLSTAEIEAAEITLLRLTQQQCFFGEDDRLKSMDVLRDEMGLLRLKTLVENRTDTSNFRHPIILDRRNALVTRLIENTHHKLNHAGTDTVMNVLRERFWILSCRRAVSAVVKRCVLCKRYHSKRVESSPSSLPEDRVRLANVFEVTGIDYAGPLYLKDGSKVWICLFTCGVYRAIHLELVSSLSTDVFLEAFRRFVARRGRPSVVYLDNGTNFVGAERAVRGLNWEQIAEYATVEKITWHFNPPSAPWWGGWWERLVRSVKELMRKTLRRSSLTYEELSTVLCDCEDVINCRPLTYLAEDPEQLIPLSPVLFLRDIRVSGTPDLDAVDATALNRRQRYRQELRDHLRRRFRVEYLGQLSRGTSRVKETRAVKLGDIVLVGNDQQKRLDWSLGKIIRLFPGRDGIVRVAQIKTAKGQLTRPVQRLFPLELNSNDESDMWSEIQSQVKQTRKSSVSLEDNSASQGSESTEVGESKEKPAISVESRNEEKRSGNAENCKKRVIDVPLRSENRSRRGRVVKVPTRYQ